MDFRLPISEKRREIIDAIRTSQVLIVSGDTGCGKTTQLPQYCLEAGRGKSGRIGCTQPRRIASITVAERIAEELREPLGRTVGYQIRFQDRTSRTTRIKIMTDGILLAETLSDPLLSRYDTLIIDEAHERSLNIDFLLGYLRKLIRRRPELSVIITSATLDTQRFSKAFDHAPIISVSGKTYPVEVHFEEAEVSDDDAETEATYVERAVEAIVHLHATGNHGDMLVFMPTEQDIRETCDLIAAKNLRHTVLLPLFARLPASEQRRVFSSCAEQKIIVATNIAETSITIPGIRTVIDTGLARISQYSPRTRTTSLLVKPISQSSAEQRKGRAGRTASGLCIRLYSYEDFLARSLYTKPEILRANLAEVILRMLSLRLGDIFDFPFIDRPDTKSIADGYQLLLELGAVRKDRQQGHRLTDSGRIMARIPVDPRISRMLLQAQQEGCTEDILVLAAALSISDPKERPADKAGEADAVHRKFFDPWSDFSTFLNIWNRYRSERVGGGATSQNERRRFCKQHFLSYRRMREWQDIHGQLVEILDECGLKTQNASLSSEPDPADEFGPRYAAIHRSILAGFLSNIALRKEKNFYRAARDRDVMLFPGSCLFNRNAMWIIAAEMVETSRVFARIAGRIDNKWIEPIGRHLCRYTYLHPHWEKNRGAVVATEQVSLFGLIVETGKTVSYGRSDPEEAARIFVRSALIEGDIKQRLAFLEHNRTVLDRIRDTENRLRRRDLLVGDAEIEAFYLERIGRISDVRSLQHLIRQNGGDDFLRMRETDMMNYEPDMDVERLFPDAIQIGDSTLTCRYRFDPGKPEDGLTVPVSISQIERLPHASLGWMVPGFFKAKVEALIKGLPKTYRKQLVPVNKTVEIITTQMPREDSDLFASLSRFIENRFHVSIPASEWSESILPDYLKTRIEVIGADGKVISSGRSARDIRPPKPGNIDNESLQRIRAQIEKEDVCDWNFDDLPETAQVTGPSGETWLLYPGLQTRRNPGERQKQAVDLKLFLDRKQASVNHLQGVAALYAKRFPQEFSFLRKAIQIPSPARGKKSQEAMRFETALFEGVLMHLFAKPIRNRRDFMQHAQDTFPDMLRFASELKGLALGIEQARRETLETIERIRNRMTLNPLTKDFFQELDDRLHTLLPADYLARYDLDRLRELPRYLRAIGIRSERASLAFEKDRAKAGRLRALEERYIACSKRLENQEGEDVLRSVATLFWWIEEYRVSLFAQELGTAIPISAKRIEKALDTLDRTPIQ